MVRGVLAHQSFKGGRKKNIRLNTETENERQKVDSMEYLLHSSAGPGWGR